MEKDRKLYNLLSGVLLIVWVVYACFSWNLDWFESITRTVYVVSLFIFWYRNWKAHQKVAYTKTMIMEKSNIKSSIYTLGVVILFSVVILIQQFSYDHFIVMLVWIYSFLAILMYCVPLILNEDKICIDGIWYMVKEMESVHIYKGSKCHDKVVFYLHGRVKRIIIKHEFKEELKRFCEQKKIPLFL